jgi:hypothetical protein
LSCLVSVAALGQQRPKNSDIENIGSRDINKGVINFYSLDKEIALGRRARRGRNPASSITN